MSRATSRLIPWRLVTISAAHVALVTASYLVAVWLRFEFTWPARESASLAAALPILLLCRLAFFARYHLFRGWWQYVGLRDVVDIAKATGAGSLAFVSIVVTTGAFPGFPRSLFVLESLLTIQFVAGARVLSRLAHALAQRARIQSRRNVLLVGSGPTAESALREFLETPSEKRPIGFLDDGSIPDRGRLRGLPCLGSVEELAEVLQDEAISEVVLALPPEGRERMRDAIRACRAAGLPFRVLSSVQQQLEDPRKVDLRGLEELFDAEIIPVDPVNVRRLFYQKTVLLLGASGQIGSALAWEIAGAGPRHLLLFDRNESPLYYLEVEFLRRTDLVPITPLIGDVRDEDRLDEIFRTYRPDVVIHAAGYTHPDLLQDNRQEVLDNNFYGADLVLRLSNEHAVERVYLLSCDEADRSELSCVHRALERLLQDASSSDSSVRAAVRFPAVLGSVACPVLRAARSLIEGRPLEVSDPAVRVPILGRSGAAALLLTAFGIAGNRDVLSIDPGRMESLREVTRYLARVWNLPEVPLQRSERVPGHRHDPESARATAHPKVLRRNLSLEPPTCVRRFLEGVAKDGSKGGELLANTSGR